ARRPDRLARPRAPCERRGLRARLPHAQGARARDPAVPAPSESVIAFEPLRHEHLPLLRDWLEREHVRRRWRDASDNLREYADAIDGRDPSEHYLIVVGSRRVGMIETYLVSDFPEWEAVVEVGAGV